MKLSKIKALLPALEKVSFRLENGKSVPEHFHVTEVGLVSKHFIDCGGTVRTEKTVNFQLWDANDFDHRLKPAKLLGIIELAEKQLGIEDFEIEVEYQAETIGKYALDFDGSEFILKNKKTDCLALDKCNIPLEKLKLPLSSLNKQTSVCCTPESGCC